MDWDCDIKRIRIKALEAGIYECLNKISQDGWEVASDSVYVLVKRPKKESSPPPDPAQTLTRDEIIEDLNKEHDDDDD